MEEVFTITQLKEAWTSYKTGKAMLVLKDGNWHVSDINPNVLRVDGVTQAKVITYSDAMSFPVYLEKHYKPFQQSLLI